LRWKDSLGLRIVDGDDEENSTYYSAFDWQRILQAEKERKEEAERRSKLNKCLCELQQQIDNDAEAFRNMFFGSDGYKSLKQWNAARGTNLATAVPGMFTGGLGYAGILAAGVASNEAGGYLIPPISDGMTDGKFANDIRMAAHYNYLDRSGECYKKTGLPPPALSPFRVGVFNPQE
jgi:hypothetical protein